MCHECPRHRGTHDPFRQRPCLPPQTPAWPVAQVDARGFSLRAPGEPSTCPSGCGLIPRGQSPSPLGPTALSPHPFLPLSFITSLCLRGANSDACGVVKAIQVREAGECEPKGAGGGLTVIGRAPVQAQGTIEYVGPELSDLPIFPEKQRIAQTSTASQT